MFYKFTPPRTLSLSVRAKPGAHQTKLMPLPTPNPDHLEIMLASRPVDGAANRALEEFVAGVFGGRRSGVRVVRGERGREKVVVGVLWGEFGEGEAERVDKFVREAISSGLK
jgi:uncharacterized protein YggU (UPF0235/DUF167 family)